jgi:hypothetical protein
VARLLERGKPCPGLDIFAWIVLIAGDAAIFTDRVKPARIIRRALRRQIAIMNFIIPF